MPESAGSQPAEFSPGTVVFVYSTAAVPPTIGDVIALENGQRGEVLTAEAL